MRIPALLGSSGSLAGGAPLSALVAGFGASSRVDRLVAVLRHAFPRRRAAGVGLVEHIFAVEGSGLPGLDRIAERLVG